MARFLERARIICACASVFYCPKNTFYRAGSHYLDVCFFCWLTAKPVFSSGLALSACLPSCFYIQGTCFLERARIICTSACRLRVHKPRFLERARIISTSACFFACARGAFYRAGSHYMHVCMLFCLSTGHVFPSGLALSACLYVSSLVRGARFVERARIICSFADSARPAPKSPPHSQSLKTSKLRSS